MSNPDVYADFMKYAEELIPQHVVDYDREKCFNISSYIIALESYVNEQMAAMTNETQRRFKHWSPDTRAIAAYIWACIAIKETGIAYPNKFRDMPTLN